jgi:four helix bundle protein
MKNYTELDVWLNSRYLVRDVYMLSVLFPDEEIFGLTNQMKRSAVSVPSNIAEGCGRGHAKDTLRFLFIARGSLYELETQAYLSFDLNFINEEELNKILASITICKKLLNGFINYFEKLAM